MTKTIIISLTTLLAACSPAAPPELDAGSLADSATSDVNAGSEAPRLPDCENRTGAFFCAHDNSCCRVSCTGSYECPDAQYARDVECLCQGFRCPTGTAATYCSTFTIDRKVQCPCHMTDS